MFRTSHSPRTAAIITLTRFTVDWVRDRPSRKHLFSVREILGENLSLFTSALLRRLGHLLLNMLTLFLFGRGIEGSMGVTRFWW
jgi:membrane associated rhomboid family serine protease